MAYGKTINIKKELSDLMKREIGLYAKKKNQKNHYSILNISEKNQANKEDILDFIMKIIRD